MSYLAFNCFTFTVNFKVAYAPFGLGDVHEARARPKLTLGSYALIIVIKQLRKDKAEGVR